jgi:hypothetical protein
VEILQLRHNAACWICGIALPQWSRAAWDEVRRRATCEPCCREVDRRRAHAEIRALRATADLRDPLGAFA